MKHKISLQVTKWNFMFHKVKLVTWEKKIHIKFFNVVTWVVMPFCITWFHKSLLKNNKFHLELPSQSWKIKSFTSSYYLEVEKQKISFWVTNSKLKNKKFHFDLLTCRWKIKKFTSSYQLDGWTFIFHFRPEAGKWKKSHKYYN